MKTIYSFLPIKKRIKILEFINYHLQRHPTCELSSVAVSPKGIHLELRFLGIEENCLLIPLCRPSQYQYYTIRYSNLRTEAFIDLEGALLELETLLVWKWTL